MLSIDGTYIVRFVPETTTKIESGLGEGRAIGQRSSVDLSACCVYIFADEQVAKKHPFKLPLSLHMIK